MSANKRAQSRATVAPWHAFETTLVTRLLRVDAIRGLTTADVATRQLSDGPNSKVGVGSQRINSMLVLLGLSTAVGFVLTAAILNGVSSDNIAAYSLLTVIAIGSIVGFAFVLKYARALDTMHRAAEVCARVRGDDKQTSPGRTKIQNENRTHT